MTDKDYIRKAIELADGWSITISDQGEMTSFYAPMCLPRATIKEMSVLGVRLDKVSQQMLDALAAQLVRQVDATNKYVVTVEHKVFIHYYDEHKYRKIIAGADSDNRTMNTIKAIVDSGVLS